MSLLTQWVILIIFAFLPPLIYVVWIRNTERFNRQNWGSIVVCFLWGATIAALAAIILEGILDIPLSLSIENDNILYVITAVGLAPVVEEFTKPLALRLRSVKKGIKEYEDGLIYGAVAGLGFSATENLIYGVSFFSEGLFIFLILMLIRSFSGCLLHASATALTGYGYGKMLMKHTSFLRIIPYFFLAILVHGFYNFLVTFDMPGMLTGLILSFAFVVITITFVRKTIKRLDVQTQS